MKTREQIEAQLRLENPTTTDDSGERHGPGSPVYEAAIMRWADAMEASQPIRKTWSSADLFLEEFELSEVAGIELSTNPTIAALRLILAAWSSEVWADDPRILLGMSALVESGIISNERSNEILSF